MILTDCHMHTSFSSDSEAPMRDMIEEGIRLGLKTITFTEHYDHDFPVIEGLDFSLDFDTYYDTVHSYKEEYADRIEILHGIEVGIQPHIGADLNALYEKNGHRYDFIIGSCHLVSRIDPYDSRYFGAHPGKEGMHLYFEETLKNLSVYEQFQTCAHLDYAIRYMKEPRPDFHYSDYADVLEAILDFIIRKDKALEINTAGWKKGLPYPNPHIEIMKRYKEKGGELLTIGSDAHNPVDMAYGFDRLPELLKSVGFDSYCIYRNQQPVFLPIK